MKIRITQRTEFGDKVVMPGEIIEVDDVVADELIANDSAVAWETEEDIEPLIKRQRKVK